MVATYRFLAEDIITGRIIHQHLPLNDVRYGEELNRSGFLSGTIPVDATSTETIWPGRTAIYVERNGRIDFGGPLWEANVTGDVAQIDIDGWPDYFNHRTIWQDTIIGTDIEQFEIFKRLVDDAQSATLGTGMDLGIDVVWSAASGQPRVRKEEYRDFNAKNLGEALWQLAALENGFDFAMEYAIAGDTITKKIRLHYPHRGRDTGFRFIYQPGRDTNIISREIGWSARKMAWRVRGWGDGADTARLRSDQTDGTLRGVYPPLDAAPGFTGVVVQSTLDEHARAWRSRVNHPLRIPMITVDPNAASAPWGSYELGDTIHVRLVGSSSDALDNLDGNYRIIGYSMDTVDDLPTLTLDEAA